MAHPVYRDLSVAAGFGLVQCGACPYSGIDAGKGYCGTGRPEFYTGCFERGLHYIHVDRDYRVFHDSDRIGMDHSERWRGKLREAGQFVGTERR